jgi:hypothetical protein
LADLFTSLHFADLSSAEWALPIRWSKKEFGDSAAHGRQTRLRRWGVGSFSGSLRWGGGIEVRSQQK